MKFARAVGWFNTRLLLTIVYFVLFVFPAIIFKLIRKDMLDRRWNSASSTYWKDKERSEHTLENARHQF
jgi:hypothetical protein